MSRLPFSATRLEGRDFDTRGDRIPVNLRHPVGEVDDYMDDIIRNTISYIQERAKDSELRTFYFNLMSDKDYRNKDFEDLVMFIGDLIDVAICEGKFREVDEAIIPASEEVVDLHVAYQTEEFRELNDYVDRNHRRNIEKAVNTYESYADALDVYRRNGNKVPNRRSRSTSRRDRDDRDDDRVRGRSGRNVNRDKWNRGAVRSGVHGSRRNNNSNRANLNGNTSQETRFDDVIIDGNERDGGLSSRSQERDHRDDERAPRARVQRMPVSDIDDALDRERNSTKESDNMNDRIETLDDLESANKKVFLLARENKDAWLPSSVHPHPFVINCNQELQWELDAVNGSIIPRVTEKDNVVNYYEHSSMAFGTYPKELSRFENGDVLRRVNDLHEALITPKFTINAEGSEPAEYRRSVAFDEVPLVSSSVKSAFLRLTYKHVGLNEEQIASGTKDSVEIASAPAYIYEVFMCTEEEAALLEELRPISSFTKLAEKLRAIAPLLRSHIYIALNAYVTNAVNRMIRQCLSIPAERITDFTGDWFELFVLLSKNYGEAYRDAITNNQADEIRHLFAPEQMADLHVRNKFGLTNGSNTAAPFVAAMSTRVVRINEVSSKLDMDLLPGVGSQLVPESNPFFHDLAQEVLGKERKKYGRAYVQTTDLRVLEISRSWMNPDAMLIRLIK